MIFRTRLVVAVWATTLVTFGGAFAAVSVVINHSELRQLDDALRAEAREEARETSDLGGDRLSIEERPPPNAEEYVHLTKFGAIYGPDGAVRARTSNFASCVPAFSTLVHGAPPVPQDIRCGPDTLRAVLVHEPNDPGKMLLLAAPRTALDADAAFLARTILVALALALVATGTVTWWIVRGLTRDHDAIARAARRVAGGDLSARVATHSSDKDIAQLAIDVNEMISRLGLLVESQQRFIAHAAHELRSPLTTLYGELSHACRRDRDAATYRQAIEEALDSTRRLKVLAEDLLALARLGANEDAEVFPVALAEVIDAAAGGVEKAAAAVGVKVVLKSEAVTIVGRSRDLERMVRNLLDNALRHSPADGRVEVRARMCGDFVEVAVTDEGTGVALADRDRIFDPFYRASSEATGEGTGLGLSIVREIARAHGGDVTLDSGPRGDKEPRGARFVARLPAKPALAPDAARA